MIKCINFVAKGTIEAHVLEVFKAKTEVFRRAIQGTSPTLPTRATSGKYWPRSSRLPEGQVIGMSIGGTAVGQDLWAGRLLGW